MRYKPAFTVANGLATLGPELVRIKGLLEGHFCAWASECQAEAMLYPPMMRVEDLSNLDYFLNFPHLALVASRIRDESLAADYAKNDPVRSIPPSHLVASEYVLPSAACYNIYVHLRGCKIETPRYITTVASCFRNEKEYTGLQRLWGFTMREIVCIADADTVQSHLASFKQRIGEFAAELGLRLETEVATDPFYQPQSSRAVMQKLFPVKEEFVYKGSVAIASVNFHRNFFGERCQISLDDERFAFSGCVAFGLERWLHALLDQYEGNTDDIIRRLAF